MKPWLIVGAMFAMYAIGYRHGMEPNTMATRAPLDIIAENLRDAERPWRAAKDAARIMAALATEGFEIVRKPD